MKFRQETLDERKHIASIAMAQSGKIEIELKNYLPESGLFSALKGSLKVLYTSEEI